MPKHDELRKTWQPGQCWETCNLNKDGTLMEQWCPVGNGGYAEPMWDAHQEYRQRPLADHFPQESPWPGMVQVTNIERVAPGGPNDVYVVDIPYQIDPANVPHIASEVMRVFQLPDQSRILIMAGGAKLKVVDASIIAGNGHAKSS